MMTTRFRAVYVAIAGTMLILGVRVWDLAVASRDARCVSALEARDGDTFCLYEAGTGLERVWPQHSRFPPDLPQLRTWLSARSTQYAITNTYTDSAVQLEYAEHDILSGSKKVPQLLGVKTLAILAWDDDFSSVEYVFQDADILHSAGAGRWAIGYRAAPGIKWYIWDIATKQFEGPPIEGPDAVFADTPAWVAALHDGTIVSAVDGQLRVVGSSRPDGALSAVLAQNTVRRVVPLSSGRGIGIELRQASGKLLQYLWFPEQNVAMKLDAIDVGNTSSDQATHDLLFPSFEGGIAAKIVATQDRVEAARVDFATTEYRRVTSISPDKTKVACWRSANLGKTAEYAVMEIDKIANTAKELEVVETLGHFHVWLPSNLSKPDHVHIIDAPG